MTTHTCADCAYADSAWHCRRNAPVGRVSSENVLSAEWPKIKEDDWCGEWFDSTTDFAARR